MTYRLPPKPEYFDTVPEGTCRWCNTLTGLTPKGKVKKSRWHPECLSEYKFYFWNNETRKQVYRRDKGICNVCKIDTQKKWDLDHITPLIESKNNVDMSFWQMGNLQTLCRPCHKIKTANEATSRAQTRKNKNAS